MTTPVLDVPNENRVMPIPVPYGCRTPNYNPYAPYGITDYLTKDEMKLIWKEASSNTKHQVQADDLIDLFSGMVLRVNFPKFKSLYGQNVNVEVSLRSGDYRNIHEWIKGNKKAIDRYILKNMYSTYGADFSTYRLFNLVHMRAGILLYQFELKPELRVQVKAKKRKTSYRKDGTHPAT